MLQDWLVVAPSSKNITVSTVLFDKYEEVNIAFTNCVSQFSMFPTKGTVKLENENKVHAQGIDIILCLLPLCPIIYLFVPVYYYTGHPFNTISLGALKYYVCFQKVTY